MKLLKFIDCIDKNEEKNSNIDEENEKEIILELGLKKSENKNKTIKESLKKSL